MLISTNHKGQKMANNRESRLPAEYRPITMWGYFGYSLLFAIPVVGWIFIVIFALTANNQNLKNFARSQFCVLIIWLVLICISAFSGFFTMLVENMMH